MVWWSRSKASGGANFSARTPVSPIEGELFFGDCNKKLHEMLGQVSAET
jgi:hypothetical protein